MKANHFIIWISISPYSNNLFAFITISLNLSTFYWLKKDSCLGFNLKETFSWSYMKNIREIITLTLNWSFLTSQMIFYWFRSRRCATTSATDLWTSPTKKTREKETKKTTRECRRTQSDSITTGWTEKNYNYLVSPKYFLLFKIESLVILFQS